MPSSSRRREIVEAVSAELDSAGFSYVFEHGGKHDKIVVEVNGRRETIVISSSPSDRRALKNAVGFIKRKIREWKAEAGVRAVRPATAPHLSLEIDEVQHRTELHQSNEVVEVLGRQITKVEYKGQRVVTLRQIDEVHGRKGGTARRQFNANRNRFVDGVDYFELTSDEIRTMSDAGVFPDRTARGSLYTERGYRKIAKGWNDDLSWRLFDEMADVYFAVKSALPAPSTGSLEDALASFLADFETRSQSIDRRLSAIESMLLDPEGRGALTVPALRQQLWGAAQWEDARFKARLEETVRAILGGQKKVIANPQTWAKAGFAPMPVGEGSQFWSCEELCALIINADKIHSRLTSWVSRDILIPKARSEGWPQRQSESRSRSQRPIVLFPLVHARTHIQSREIREAIILYNQKLWSTAKGQTNLRLAQ